jgi:hypothetical protein
VRHDSTLIILHSGNFEYVCVRHRETQTLYISDLINIPYCANPGYGKLQIGIYIAAVQDAMQRAAQMSPVDQSADIKDASKEKGNDIDLDVNRMMNEISNRNGMLMHFQYGVYNSPTPAPFIRKLPSTQREEVLQPAECFMLVVTSEIATGAIGIVHGGTIEVELPGQCLTLKAVVKLAFSDHQQERLAHEYSIYRYLISKGVRGIATPLGLFNSFEDGPSALLMTYQGISISTTKQPISLMARSVFTLLTLLCVNETIGRNFLASCGRFTRLVSCMVTFAVRICLLTIWVMRVLWISTGQ